jgi:hypothetical protein
VCQPKHVLENYFATLLSLAWCCCCCCRCRLVAARALHVASLAWSPALIISQVGLFLFSSGLPSLLFLIFWLGNLFIFLFFSSHNST